MNTVKTLFGVTADMPYAIYVVQVAIAVLIFIISMPVFYLRGYGNILFCSFLAAFCELNPYSNHRSHYSWSGRYPGSVYHVLPGVPDRIVRAGDLYPAGSRREAGEDPSADHVHRYHRRYPDHGVAGFVLGPLMIVMIITTYRLYVQEKKNRAGSSLPSS
jgi:hypothetical protein